MSTNDGQAAGEVFDPTTTSELPSSLVTRLCLLRHGAVEDFGERRVRGQLDAPLSSAGVAQHGELVEWFVAQHGAPDVLHTSDLTRCAELARALGDRTGVEPRATRELREQHMGAWQGKTWEEITAADAARVHAYWDDYQSTAPPGGESLTDLFERVQAWWRPQESALVGRRVAIVTHVGVIRSLLCGFLGVPPSEALRFAPAVGSCTELLLSDAGAVLQSLGERPWLARP